MFETMTPATIWSFQQKPTNGYLMLKLLLYKLALNNNQWKNLISSWPKWKLSDPSRNLKWSSQMGLTQVNTRSHLGQSYHVRTLTLNVPDMKLDLTPCPGSVLEKNSRLIFLDLKFLIFLFFWVWKNLSYFFGSEDFSLIFLGGQFWYNLFFWVSD